MISVIITAAGSASRSGLNFNKVLWQMSNGLSVLQNATAPFELFDEIDEIVYAVTPDDLEKIKALTSNCKKKVSYVIGGQTRFQSVFNALKTVKSPYVLIHDGARPFIDCETVRNCIRTLIDKGTAITCTPCIDTIATANERNEIVSADRRNKFSVQTPQGFKTEKLLKAYSMVENPNDFTDDSGIYARYVEPVCISEGSYENQKLTTANDFKKLQLQKVGTGYDLHVLTQNRKLVLGGVEIPHDKGLLGHSDADVLTHAIMDSLLSALSLRDIGYHFSDKDPKYKDVSSMLLLKRVLEMLYENGYKPYNVSATIMAEKPKLSPFVESITQNLANALGLPTNAVGITCTTSEKVGLIGREQAIAVHAVCSVVKI